MSLSSWHPSLSAGRSAPALSLRACVSAAWATVIPVSCAGCERWDHILCPECTVAFTREPRTSILADDTTVVSALDYDGAVRAAIIAFKEKHRVDVAPRLAVPFRQAIVTALATCAPGAGIELVTIPTNERSWRARGFSPVGMLARAAGVLSTSRPLRYERTPQPQKKLSREEREVNRRGMLRPVGSLIGRRFIVIDDVVTTGATVMETSRALRSAGAEVCAVAALAQAPTRLHQRSLSP